MEQEPTTRVVLQLGAGDPISGSVQPPDRRAEPFCGWLELVAALEHARRDQEQEKESP